MNMEIVKEEHVTPWQALDILQEKEELTEKQEKCLEHLRKHLLIKDEKTVEELKQELKQVGDFKDHQLDKLVEILPFSKDTVRSIFSKERIKLEDEQVERILEICDSVKEG